MVVEIWLKSRCADISAQFAGMRRVVALADAWQLSLFAKRNYDEILLIRAVRKLNWPNAILHQILFSYPI